MDNLLLVFPHKVSNTKEWDNIINKFDKENYYVYLVQDISSIDFDIGYLPDIIDYYKSLHKNVNKIVVMSNARDLILSWYRCYNSIVDDFIYFIDEDEKNYYNFNDELFFFVDRLSSLIDIEKEKIQGKVFININDYNYSSISTFLLENNRFKNFDSIENFDFYVKSDKIKQSKRYILNGITYNFDLACSTYDTVNVNTENSLKIIIDKKFSLLLKENIYFIKYALIEIYKYRNDNQANNYLIQLFTQLGQELNLNQREKILDGILEYIDSNKIFFMEKAYMLSLCVLLKSKRTILGEKMIEILNEDKSEDSLNYHFHMLTNILMFKGHENLKLSNKVYIGIRKEIVKLAKFSKEQVKIKVDKRHSNDDKIRIAIHYDQLLDIKHAPTRLALDVAKNFKKYCENCEVKIFVEDNFIVNSNEIALVHAYSSCESIQCKEIHRKYLKDYNVEIYYSNPCESKFERTKEIVEEISKFNPSVIYSTSDISLAREILYPYYPIVYQTHGGTNFSTLCDVYVLYGNSQKEKLLQINNEIRLIDENKIIINEQPGFVNEQFKKDYRKIDLGLSEESFIMVTVGNRLNTELSDNFVDLIISFINEKNNVVWILVGPNDVPYIITKYKDLINARKIIKIGYEDDLLSLYKICDVYINPVRSGGAGSVSIAMQCGVPSIVEKTSQDSVFIIGEENCVANDKEAYIDELERLYQDKNYKESKSKLMKKIIENKNGWDIYIEKYLKIFDVAKENYCKRINN